jgi:non-heme chloroperoxidase
MSTSASSPRAKLGTFAWPNAAFLGSHPVILRHTMFLLLLSPVLRGQIYAAQNAPDDWRDPSPHRREMIAVEQGVQLEVLDWGGSGHPLVFLSGLGNTAHIWDNFAPKFTGNHHVYAITRRGFGRSTHVTTGYSPERLSDDILTVIDQLKLERPVLVGHSIAGEELSFIGTHHPERVSALIYLDAAYTYAFYDEVGDYEASLKDLRQKIDALDGKPDDTTLIDQVKAGLPQFEENLNRKSNSLKNPLPHLYDPPSAADKASFAAMMKRMTIIIGGVPPEAELHESFLPGPNGSVGSSNSAPEAGPTINENYEHFTAPIHLPILAIMSYPQNKGPNFQADLPKNIAAAGAADAEQARQIDAFEKGQPTAHVVRIAGAHHYVFISNEDQVESDMKRFLAALP